MQSNRLALVAPLSVILAAAGATNFACSNSDDDNNNAKADSGVYIDGGIQEGVPPGSGYTPPAGGDDDDDDDSGTSPGNEAGTPPTDGGGGDTGTTPPTDAGDAGDSGGGGGSGIVAAVLVIGDGTNALAAVGSTNPTSIQYIKANGTVVSTVTFPSDTTAGTALTVSSSSLDGQISRSADGKYLLVPGYNLTKGTAITTAGGRIVGRLAATGAPDLSTKVVGTGFDAANFRGVASPDGTTLFVGGSAGGVYSLSFGATTAATAVSATPANTRGLNVYGTSLYVTTGATPYGLFATPLTAPTTVVALPGFSTTKPASTQSVGFDTDGNGSIDIFYVADEELGVQKWTLTGTTWGIAETFATGGAIGVTGTFAAGTATLYAVNYGTGDITQLYTFTDTPASTTPATPTKIGAVGTANFAYRGIALAPTGL